MSLVRRYMKGERAGKADDERYVQIYTRPYRGTGGYAQRGRNFFTLHIPYSLYTYPIDKTTGERDV